MIAAETWNVPPWTIEAECSQEWWDRLAVWRAEVNAFEKSKGAGK